MFLKNSEKLEEKCKNEHYHRIQVLKGTVIIQQQSAKCSIYVDFKSTSAAAEADLFYSDNRLLPVVKINSTHSLSDINYIIYNIRCLFIYLFHFLLSDFVRLLICHFATLCHFVFNQSINQSVRLR